MNTSLHILLPFAAALVLFASASTALPAEPTIHVSPRGHAQPDGSPARPCGTLAQAIDLARKNGIRRITLAPGQYFDTAITFDPRDSGLIIEGPAQGQAVLFGGMPVQSWQREGELFVSSQKFPADTPIRLLIVNGQLAERARYPEAGYLTHTSDFPVKWMSTTDGGWQRKPTDEELLTMHYKPEDIPQTLSAASAEVTVYHMWDESCVPVASIDRQKHILHFATKPGHPAGAFDVKRYVIWNTAEGLTRPGQFYHDRDKLRLVYRPRPGETPENLRAIIGTRPSILEIKGTKDRPAADITLRNLSFQATTIPIKAGGFGALGFSGAISMQHAKGLRLQNLQIANVAGQGIDSTWNQTSSDVLIEGCEVSQCGAGGITVGGQKITIRNNHIHHIGLYSPSAIGIARGGTDCLIEGNTLHDCTYTGIQSSGQRNIIRGNTISRCMTVLFDGGAIYLSMGKGSIVEHNVCRDIGGTGGYARTGYYLDEQCEDTTVRNNIAINVDVPLHNHMAKNCTLENNVLVNDGDLKIAAGRCEGFTMRGNIAWAGGKLEVSGANAFVAWGNNILFSKAGQVSFTVLKQYSPTGKLDAPPQGVLIADPLFVDVAKRDLRFAPASPARQLGLSELTLPAAAVK